MRTKRLPKMLHQVWIHSQRRKTLSLALRDNSAFHSSFRESNSSLSRRSIIGTQPIRMPQDGAGPVARASAPQHRAGTAESFQDKNRIARNHVLSAFKHGLDPPRDSKAHAGP